MISVSFFFFQFLIACVVAARRMRSICHVQSIKKMFVESIPLIGIDLVSGSLVRKEKREAKKQTDIL